LLRLGCTIAQSAEAMEADRAGEGVARLALVEFRSRLPPEPGRSNQSSINRVRSIRPISRNVSAKPFWRGYGKRTVRPARVLRGDQPEADGGFGKKKTPAGGPGFSRGRARGKKLDRPGDV
jgi:hypothetical protein